MLVVLRSGYNTAKSLPHLQYELKPDGYLSNYLEEAAGIFFWAKASAF